MTKNFTYQELIHTNYNFSNIPNEESKVNLQYLADNFLQPLRDLLGVPVHVTSAYRSPQVNKAVGGVVNSYHLKGLACDIHVDGISSETLYLIICHNFKKIKRECYYKSNFVHFAINK